MDDMHKLLTRQTLDVEQRLKTETNLREWARLKNAQAKLAAYRDYPTATIGGGASLLSLRAEECRAIADSCASPSARHTYNRMARVYDELAARASAPAVPKYPLPQAEPK